MRSIIRAENAREILVRAHDDVARNVGIGDGSMTEDERAPPSTPPLRRSSGVAVALDRLVFRLLLGLAIADHLVLLPAWRRTLKPPPITPGLRFALARPFSDAWASPRTHTANRPAVQTALRRRSKARRYMVLANASLPQSDYP